jgi:membrane-anchored protein YejM (alkaline phosphatase superfamily)
MAKIEERQKNRQYFECIAHTIDHIVDSVCSSISTSSCLCIELTTKNETQTILLNDQMNILITHLCDDEDTQQVRSSIQNRYEQLMSIVDSKIQTILLEHQTIQTQMAFELGIIPNDLSDDYLSYDTHESALRTAIERLKC